MTRSVYTSSVYATRDAATRHAAERILDTVFEHIPAETVLDVGCGTGTWLAVCREKGISDLLGLEGPWLPDDVVEVPAQHIRRTDLDKGLEIDSTFDLAICLEVAEHLSPDRAESLVAELCAARPAVLFSAAIPGQGGLNHVNERWQSYWTSLFESHGYAVCDIVRPAIWHDSKINACYRQNTFLFLSPNVQFPGDGFNRGVSPFPADVVHPVMFAMKHNQRLAVRRNGRLFLQAIRATVERRLRKKNRRQTSPERALQATLRR